MNVNFSRIHQRTDHIYMQPRRLFGCGPRKCPDYTATDVNECPLQTISILALFSSQEPRAKTHTGFIFCFYYVQEIKCFFVLCFSPKIHLYEQLNVMKSRLS